MTEYLSDPVTGIRVLPDGPFYALDDFRVDGRRLNRIAIGRDSVCDIRIDHRSVSGMHSFLFREGSRIYVEEWRNKNRVYINDTPFRGGTVELFSGFVLRVGRVRLLACGRAGELQAAVIPTRGVDELLGKAVDFMYGSQRRAAKLLSIPLPTLNRWYRNKRFEDREPKTGNQPASTDKKPKEG